MKLPTLTFKRDGGGAFSRAAWQLVAGSERGELQTSESLELMALYTHYRSEEALLEAALSILPGAGTFVELFHLHPDALDFTSDEGDIRLVKGAQTHTRMDADAAPLLDTSLRAYLEVLYQPGRARNSGGGGDMEIVLRGAPVVPRVVAATLYKPQTFTVDLGHSVANRATMTFGLLLASAPEGGARRGLLPKLSPEQGLFFYWRGRLIRAHERVGVQKKTSGGLPGVVAVVQVASLDVESSKQAFKDTSSYRNLIKHAADNMQLYLQECYAGSNNNGVPLLSLEGLSRLTDEAADEVARMAEAAEQARAVDNDGRDVVFCDACHKYRFLEDADFEALDKDADWLCAMNSNAAYACCYAPEEEPRCGGAGRARKPEEPCPHPPAWLPPGWRAVLVTRASGDLQDLYFYAPGGNPRRFRSRRCEAPQGRQGCRCTCA